LPYYNPNRLPLQRPASGKTSLALPNFWAALPVVFGILPKTSTLFLSKMSNFQRWLALYAPEVRTDHSRKWPPQACICPQKACANCTIFYRSPQDSFVKFLEKGLKKRHKYAMMQK
jgi:hypothetical protein